MYSRNVGHTVINNLSIADFPAERKEFMYKIMDEKLKIASCSLADLTTKQVNSFLSQWEEGARIGSLTVFYEMNSGYLVVNEDHRDSDFYKEFVKEYFVASEEGREKFSKVIPKSLEETIKVLDSCIKHRTVDNEIHMALKNYVGGDLHIAVLNEIWKRYDTPAVIAATAFCYGVMTGKRMERAKKAK